MRNKKFVSVVVSVDEIGNKKPKSIGYNDREYIIDKVLDMKKCVSFKAGGIGERYTVRIEGKETYLFYEMGRWFVEEKVVANRG
jgi:hypothetical protein